MVASLMMMMMFDVSAFELLKPLEPDLMSAVAAANPGSGWPQRAATSTRFVERRCHPVVQVGITSSNDVIKMR